ncbi:hypothetical protein GJV85_05150 [Sulfurimonas aquatica]|uniref:Uncharacterized protein n=1 Tax=Sulfurimonas aquatica TaxID=2672570 RepID=A0A975AZM6_9BACT|nr:hypothetical protein [Sulfurimonas aquatica]QSZ41516.1 hypothetical protein GJV85_05150 [Sulfurimonas aquatica]
MDTPVAQGIAREYLDKIGISHISLYRAPSCSSLEIFYTMFIRAIMTKEKKILIERPHKMIDNLQEINTILKMLESINDDKEIVILDTYDNEFYYEGCICNIIR